MAGQASEVLTGAGGVLYPSARLLAFSWLICVVYGLLLEGLQWMMKTGREAEAGDLLANALGALAACVVFRHFSRLDRFNMSVDLFATVAAGGVVLTANKRLARHLVEQFDQAQMAAGRSVWPSPAILSFDAWLMRQIQQQREEHRLLTESQAQHIWEEIVGTDAAAAGRDLLQVPQAARRAREAHRLLQAYLADFTASDADEDQLSFLRWRKRSQERMHRDQLLERADLLALVTAAIAAGRAAVPSVLALAGFDDLTPAVHQLCVALEARGCLVSTWDPPVNYDQ